MGRLCILALFTLAGALAVAQTAAQWEELAPEEGTAGSGEGAWSLLSQVLPPFLGALLLMAVTICGT